MREEAEHDLLHARVRDRGQVIRVGHDLRARAGQRLRELLGAADDRVLGSRHDQDGERQPAEHIETRERALGARQRGERAQVVATTLGERAERARGRIDDRGGILRVERRGDRSHLGPRLQHSIADTAEDRGAHAARLALEQAQRKVRAHRVAEDVDRARVRVAQHLLEVRRHAVVPVRGRIVRLVAVAVSPQSSATTRRPAFVRARTQPICTRLSSALLAKPCTSRAIGAVGSPYCSKRIRTPSASIVGTFGSSSQVSPESPPSTTSD